MDGGEWCRLTTGSYYQLGGETRVKVFSSTMAKVYGLAENQSHTVRARYVSTKNERSSTGSRSFTLLPGALFKVKSLKVSQTEELTLTVSWTPFATANDVQYAVAVSQGRKTIKTATVSGTSVVLKVPAKGKYTVSVTPRNASRKGIASSVIRNVIANWWKSAPAIVKRSQTDTKELTIWFKAARYATGYTLYDNGRKVTSGVKLTLNGVDSRVTITNISGSHSYQICPYRTVSGRTTYGTKSARVSFTIGSVAELAEPSDIVPVQGNDQGSIKVTWDAPKATGFRVYVKDVLTGSSHEVSGASLSLKSGWSAVISGLQAADWSVGLKPVMIKPDGK